MKHMNGLSLAGVLLIVIFLAAGFVGTRTHAEAAGAGQVVPDQYIVALKAGVNPHQAAAASGGRVLFVYEHALNGFAAQLAPQAAEALLNNPNVRSVVQDRTVAIAAPPCGTPKNPCDDDGGGGGGTQELPTGIDRIDGELSSTESGNGSGAVNVDVAVIDTGIDLDHVDLNVVGGVNCSRGNSYDDGHGHGTHVAGTIAALDDSVGVVGVAPGARLYGVRVLDNSGSGTWSSVICGVDWVTANASTIEVANMSLGGSGSEGSCTDGGLREAICNSVGAGVTYAVAAGNDSSDASGFVPAAYDEVITVSALADFDGKSGGGAASTCRSDVDDTFADFSNFGADVDLIAPGVCINSTWKGGGYNTISGTSMASPHVAGAAALYKANNPGASPSQVKSALQNAGNTDWDNSDDGDSTKEKLLNVDGF